MKIPVLRKLLEKRLEKTQYSIFFCAPDTDELNKVAKMLQEINVISHRFTGVENPGERKKILKNFETGTFQALTAMNIFNEGIDIPIAREAFILSSSSNPTEYVQRRGRVLRKLRNAVKEKATIHDFLVLPTQTGYNNISSLEKQIVKKEISRSFYFAEDALNGLSIMAQMNKILGQYIKLPLGDIEGRKQ